MVPNLALVLENIRMACLPGKEAAVTNEIMRVAQRITADNRRRPPRYVFANEVTSRSPSSGASSLENRVNFKSGSALKPW